ncbi:MAG: nickel-dependent lactate racemase [Candidatus Zixiibacteriota bacterium]|nr:MAG: nickel-dependent lactate racemase [candidate division Zixibacteria bacterium]
MKVEFPYGGEIVEMEFPDETVILSAHKYNALPDNEVYARIEKEYLSRRKDFDGKKVSIIINDLTRRVPTEKILKILFDFLPVEKVQILVATGTHPVPPEEDLKQLLGDTYKRLHGKVICHNCDDRKMLERIGITSYGTPVEISRRFLEAEAVICVNSVEPHFLAGFTGGRKSIIPGLAGRDTVIANHSLAKSAEARSLNLETNPVHIDLVEATEMAVKAPLFSIQLVLSRNGEIIDLFCGDLTDSFHEAAKLARDVYSILIGETFDVVFAIGEYPLDINLYQLQKAQEHGAEAVSKGGILVVVGACEEGIGSPYFVKLAEDYPTPEAALSDIALNDNRFGIHKLVKTARRLEKIKIWYVTKLDDKVVGKVYFVPKCSPQDALKDALDYFGGTASITILKDACFLVPERIDVKGGM